MQKGIFRIESGTDITADRLQEFINQHRMLVMSRYAELAGAYETEYDIFKIPRKPDWKPDNRLAVNFAKYIVDTMVGFFIGKPIKVSADDERVNDFVELFSRYNDTDNSDAELAKLCDIFGSGYEMYYVDEEGNLALTYLSPMESFMVYDDSVLERPRYFVRIYFDSNNVMHGSISDETTVRWFENQGHIVFDSEEKLHGFAGVPATEYLENEEGIGLYEPVMSLINAYNSVISEKANDVEYFADAYLKILGAALEENELKNLRRNRIINFDGLDAERLVVEFLQKPDGDATQEHFLDRVERLIYQISMVANISDEDFGNASGISLKYKLQAMGNLARTKERKFTSAMNRRYRLLFSNPVSGMQRDAWTQLSYRFTLNYPSNELEEAQIAAQLAGIVSRETQLATLSIVENVQDEIDRMDEDANNWTDGYNITRVNEDVEQ